MKIKGYDINAKSIGSFIRGTTLKFLDDTELRKLPDYQAEQVLLRSALCVQCLEDGKCNYVKEGENEPCKCKTPDLFYDPLREDSAGRWGPMMSEEQWEEFVHLVSGVAKGRYMAYYNDQLKLNGSTQPKKVTKQLKQNRVFNAGYTKKNTPVKHSFVLKNSLDETIEIKAISSGCACTVPSFSKGKIEPGSEFVVDVEYNGKHDGVYNRVVSVKFTDETIEPVTLTIKGTTRQ